MNIKAWHEKLNVHFRTLYQERIKGEGWPTYCLEHGLSPQEIKELKHTIQTEIKNAVLSDTYWLPWIIYAAEVGYEYEGYEYWQSFEEKSPGWAQHGDRHKIREMFCRFAQKFGGAKPSGVWAGHFTIICWPITHAILPKDLQRQLAKVLYDLRYSFNENLLRSPDKLGEQIAQRSVFGTTRFQQFSQNTSLVGQIATALLFHEAELARTLLLPSTLQRITKDIEKEQRSREWLRDARTRAQRVKLDGLSRGSAPQRTYPVSPQEARMELAELAIEPRVILRPESPFAWKVFLEVPDFAPVLSRFPKLRAVLANSRCKVKGSVEWLARGRLLNRGPQRIALRTWPQSNEVLLEFEQPPPNDLANLLRAEALLRPGSTWLCRIASDGLAYEVRSQVVRPQSNYIVLSTAGPFETGSYIEPTTVSCSGVFAGRLNMPKAVGAKWQHQVESIGLNLAKSIHVWPAGLMASEWDGEGRGEWLSNEKATIGIQVDHAIDALLLKLGEDRGVAVEIHQEKLGDPIFVQLLSLPIGLHLLQVLARTPQSDGQFEELGQLELAIREPRPWTPGVCNQNALIVTLDPTHPTLDQLLEGRVQLDIHGPRGRRVTTTINLWGKDSSNQLLSKTLPPLQLPVGSNVWQTSFDQRMREESAQNAIELAYSCRIDLDGEELGAFSLVCEREFEPLRWILQTVGRRYILNLVDDSGGIEPAKVTKYEFSEPDLPIPMPNADLMRDYGVSSSGGMFTALTQHASCGIIIPHEIRTWADLRAVKPKLKHRKQSLENLMELLALLELWSSSQVRNIFALWSQREVLRALLTQTFSLLGGHKWESAEQAFCHNPTAPRAIENFSRALSRNWYEEKLAMQVLQRYQDVKHRSLAPKEYVSEIASVISKFVDRLDLNFLEPSRGGVGTPRLLRGVPWYTEFAFRLASAPHTIRRWSGDWLKAGFTQLLRAPIVARIARFAVLVVDHQLRHFDNKSGTSLFAGWEWS